MQISAAAPMTPVKTFDTPSTPHLQKTVKILAITQVALLALSIIGALAFVIATAVTLNAYLLIGAGLCGIVAFAILGRNLCCRSMVKREETVFIPRHEGPYHDQAFVQGFQTRSPLVRRPIPWPEARIAAGRQISWR
jgi:hypothetical protein